MRDDSAMPVVKGVSYFLGHVPGLTRHGSKPSREIPKDPALLDNVPLQPVYLKGKNFPGIWVRKRSLLSM